MYDRFMKDVLNEKEKLIEEEKLELDVNCSVLI